MSVDFTYDIASNSWSSSGLPESLEFNVSLGVTDGDASPVVFESFSVGCEVYVDGVVQDSYVFPPQGGVCLSSDQTHIIAFRAVGDWGKSVVLRFSIENSGVRSDYEQQVFFPEVNLDED